MRPPHHRRPTDHTQRQGVVGAPTKEDVAEAQVFWRLGHTLLRLEHGFLLVDHHLFVGPRTAPSTRWRRSLFAARAAGGAHRKRGGSGCMGGSQVGVCFAASHRGAGLAGGVATTRRRRSQLLRARWWKARRPLPFPTQGWTIWSAGWPAHPLAVGAGRRSQAALPCAADGRFGVDASHAGLTC